MAKEILDPALWERFEEAARKRRRDPARLLKNFMKGRLEIWEDQRVDRHVKKTVLRSGRREKDAVEIVRRHRTIRASKVTLDHSQAPITTASYVLNESNRCNGL